MKGRGSPDRNLADHYLACDVRRTIRQAERRSELGGARRETY